MNPNEPTVSVRMTAAGQKAAQGGTLFVHGSGREVSFTGDSVETVLLSDWNQVLRSTAPYGEHYFEQVPAAAPALVPPAKATGTKPTPAPSSPAQTDSEAAK